MNRSQCSSRQSALARIRGFVRPSLVVALLLGAITACSGGGDSESSPNEGSSGLTGTIIATTHDTEDFGVIYSINATSGAASIADFARVTRRDESTYDQLADFYIGRPHAGQQPIVGINDCIPDIPPPGTAAGDSCVETIDESGEFIRLFTLNRELADRPSQSPDGSLIAIVTNTPSADFVRGIQTLELRSRSGEILDSRLIDVSRESDPYIVEWTPDNRLVFATRLEGEATFITVTEPLSLTSSVAFLVSENGVANVRTLAVSPDGMSIAYTLFYPRNSPAARTYVLDRQTGTSRLLAESTDDQLISSPEWSPDGSSILVSNADFEFFSIVFGSGLLYKLIVPAFSDTPPFIDGEAGIGTLLDAQNVSTDFENDGFGTDFDDRFDFWRYEDRVFWVE